VRATVEEGASGDESEDALQASIEKSKKVLAMQRDLLQQVIYCVFLV
jgi:starch synthase